MGIPGRPRALFYYPKMSLARSHRYLESSADISSCGLFRYSLSRLWDGIKPAVCWIMLNPSTADGLSDDNTIRRCVNYSRSWGYGGLTVVNLFGYRSSSPKVMKSARDPVGPQNNDSIVQGATHLPLVVAAWGRYGGYKGRDLEVIQLVREKCRRDLFYLELTQDFKFPKHPLYLRKDLQPKLWYY